MWKDVKGWEQYYEVNENGDVRNKLTQHLLIGDTNNAGYCRISFYNKKHKPSKQRVFRHRLVADTFISNPNNYKEVNHIDGDKTNNCVANLEWVSRSMNEQHARSHHLKEFVPNSKFHIKMTKIVFLDGTVKQYNSQKQCASDLHVSEALIGKLIKRNNMKNYLKKYQIKEICNLIV